MHDFLIFLLGIISGGIGLTMFLVWCLSGGTR
jgi:hypothetical protein